MPREEKYNLYRVNAGLVFPRREGSKDKLCHSDSCIYVMARKDFAASLSSQRCKRLVNNFFKKVNNTFEVWLIK
jgi:hypothetical protein